MQLLSTGISIYPSATSTMIQNFSLTESFFYTVLNSIALYTMSTHSLHPNTTEENVITVVTIPIKNQMIRRTTIIVAGKDHSKVY